MQKALKFLKENIVCGMSLDDMISKDKEPSPVLYYHDSIHSFHIWYGSPIFY